MSGHAENRGFEVAGGRNRTGYALLSPTRLVMGLALAAPVGLLFLYSLKSQTGFTFDAGWTLAL